MLKAFLESIDGVEHADLYKEVDIGGGKKGYALNVEPVGGWGLEDVGGLKSALEKQKNEASSAKSALKEFEGLDPKQVREQLARLEELGKGTPDVDKIVSGKVSQLSKKFDEERLELTKRADSLRSVVDETLRKQAAIQALASARGNVDLLLPHVLSQTRTREVDGRFVVEVVNADGTVRIKDANSDMSISDLISEMKASPNYGVAFQGTDKSGSGAGGGGKHTPGQYKSEASTSDKVAFLESKYGM